jgi:EAL domain-containing protein (putative c-di-GMP-specific phosphodiesterase class I)
VSPKKFIFEIPESALIGASDVVLENLDAIRKLGIKIAIVEFGLGYSSIDTLCKVDFDFVVIDKKFTKNLLSETKVSGAVRGLLDFVKRLGAESICEGVNSEEEKQKLRKFGCKKIQGKLVGEQLTEEKLIAKYKK